MNQKSYLNQTSNRTMLETIDEEEEQERLKDSFAIDELRQDL